jgi:hypothetical protein
MKAHAAVAKQGALIPIMDSDDHLVYHESRTTTEMQAQYDSYAKRIADLTKEAKACNETLEAEVDRAKNHNPSYMPEWTYRSRQGWVRSNK